MKSTTVRRRRSSAVSGKGPLSVPLPDDLRSRLQAQAAARQLELATAARVPLDERLRELEEASLLSKSEEWQRDEAWRTWDKIASGHTEDVPVERFDEHTRRALARARCAATSGS